MVVTRRCLHEGDARVGYDFACLMKLATRAGFRAEDTESADVQDAMSNMELQDTHSTWRVTTVSRKMKTQLYSYCRLCGDPCEDGSQKMNGTRADLEWARVQIHQRSDGPCDFRP